MRFRKKQPRHLHLDITPLVDVIFLLLIFFMISTTFISYSEIRVKLPKAVTKTEQETAKPLEVTITKSGRLFIDDRPIPAEKLQEAFQRAKGKSRQSTLVIRADGQALHKNVVFVMDTAKTAGIDKLSIATVLHQ